MKNTFAEERYFSNNRIDFTILTAVVSFLNRRLREILQIHCDNPILITRSETVEILSRCILNMSHFIVYFANFVQRYNQTCRGLINVTVVSLDTLDVGKTLDPHTLLLDRVQ